MTYSSIAELLAAHPEMEKVREWEGLRRTKSTRYGKFSKYDRVWTICAKHADAALLEVANAVGTWRDDLAERISADGLCVGITDETPCSEDDSDCCLVCWTDYLNHKVAFKAMTWPEFQAARV